MLRDARCLGWCRLANRVLLVGGAERDNTEDAEFARALGGAQQRLQAAIAPAVHRAKAVALGERAHAAAWRAANAEVRPPPVLPGQTIASDLSLLAGGAGRRK